MDWYPWKNDEEYIEYARQERGTNLRPLKKMSTALLCDRTVVNFLSNPSTTNAAKVKLCYELLKEKNLLPPETELKVDKNELKSNEARQRGNVYYDAKEYMAALEAYNEALCFAPLGSEAMGFVYANRSAIYLDTGFYSFCLENIQLALDHNYPDRLKPKLQHRKAACFEKMKTQKDSYEIYGIPGELRLSCPKNQKIPFVITGLRCVQNKKFGRHVVAKRNLKPGDVVLIEEPFVQGLDKVACYTNCYNCGGNNFYNLKPCPKSTQVLFCSEDCADEAWNRFYKYEYPIVDGLIGQTPNVSSVRATLKAFTMFADPSELTDLVDDIEGRTNNPFDLNFLVATEVDKFALFYGLNTNQHTMLKHNFYVCIVHCALLFHMFMEFTDLKAVLRAPEHENLFIELMVRFDLTSRVNATRIYDRMEYDKVQGHQYALHSTGNANFLLLSMFNHSCAPNVSQVPANFKGKIGIVVLRPIKTGEQLFLSYGPTFKTPAPKRQEWLKKNYEFDCECMACIKHIPTTIPKTYFVTSNEANLMTKLLPEECRFDSSTADVAKEAKDVAAKLLKRVDHSYPCFDSAAATKSLIDALLILVFTKPFELIFTPKK